MGDTPEEAPTAKPWRKLLTHEVLRTVLLAIGVAALVWIAISLHGILDEMPEPPIRF